MYTDNLDENTSVTSDYLPYSSETIHDNTQPEDDNMISVITGNRYNGVDWSDDGGLPAGWIPKCYEGGDDNSNQPNDWMPRFQDGRSDNSILPGDWNPTSTLKTRRKDSHLPEGWKSNDNDYELNNVGWKDNSTLPVGWKVNSNNITVKRDNRCLLASKLPTIFVTNHRSFFLKFHKFV